MHDAFGVRGGQALSNLKGVFDRFARRQRATQLLAQGLAFEQLRDEVGRAVVDARVVNHEDVRMIERSESL